VRNVPRAKFQSGMVVKHTGKMPEYHQEPESFLVQVMLDNFSRFNERKSTKNIPPISCIAIFVGPFWSGYK